MAGTSRAGSIPALLLVASLAGLAFRVVGLDVSPYTFHSTRQFHGLRVARAMYLRGREDVPIWARRAAAANGRSAPQLEPRALESAVVVGYRIMGREVIWLGGLLSSVLWVLGGVALFLIARRLASNLAGLVAAGYYLFLPYGVIASRTFQPDPAMVACTIGAILAILRYHDVPTRERLLVAGGLSGLAIFVKPTACFVVLGTFAALAIHRGKGRANIGARVRPVLAYVAVTLIVPGLYVAHGLMSGNLGSNLRGSIAPRLWLSAFYWRGWLNLVNATVGLPLALVAVLAVATARTAVARAAVRGMWVGYLVFGLVFSYHIHTHDYYHLPLVPIVGLGLGLVADAAAERYRDVSLGVVARASVVVAVVFFAAMMVIGDVRVARPLTTSARQDEVATERMIGRLVGHSPRTAVLAPAYGLALEYNGDIAGWDWPSRGDNLAARRLGGHPPSAAAQFNALVGRGAEWFIITDFGEWERQDELRALLAARGSLRHQTDGYIIYRIG